METQQSPIKATALNFGLYYALFSIVILIVLYMLDMEKNLAIGVINVIGTIAIFVFAILAYKKANNNMLTLGQAIKVGLATAAIGGVILAIYTYFHYSYIQPEFIENIRTKGLEDMYAKNPDMPAEAEETAISMMNIFTSPAFISTIGIIGSLVYGLIVSLITGLVVRTKD